MRTLRHVTLCLGVCSLWDQGSPQVLNRTTPSSSCMPWTHRLLPPLLSRVPQDHQTGLVSSKSTMIHDIILITQERGSLGWCCWNPFRFSKSIVRSDCQRSISVHSVFIDASKEPWSSFPSCSGQVWMSSWWCIKHNFPHKRPPQNVWPSKIFLSPRKCYLLADHSSRANLSPAQEEAEATLLSC